MVLSMLPAWDLPKPCPVAREALSFCQPHCEAQDLPVALAANLSGCQNEALIACSFVDTSYANCFRSQDLPESLGLVLSL